VLGLIRDPAALPGGVVDDPVEAVGALGRGLLEDLGVEGGVQDREAKLRLADADDVAVDQGVLGDPATVDEEAVGRPGVADPVEVALGDDLGVQAAGGAVAEDDVPLLGATQRQAAGGDLVVRAISAAGADQLQVGLGQVRAAQEITPWPQRLLEHEGAVGLLDLGLDDIEAEDEGLDADLVPVVDRLVLDPPAAVPGAVPRAVVLEVHSVVGDHDPGVAAGDTDVWEADIVVIGAPQGEGPGFEREGAVGVPILTNRERDKPFGQNLLASSQRL